MADFGEVTAKARISIEKSGGLYAIRMRVSDDVKNHLKGDFHTYVCEINELNSFHLSAIAIKPLGKRTLEVNYSFSLSPEDQDE